MSVQYVSTRLHISVWAQKYKRTTKTTAFINKYTTGRTKPTERNGQRVQPLHLYKTTELTIKYKSIKLLQYNFHRTIIFVRHK